VPRDLTDALRDAVHVIDPPPPAAARDALETAFWHLVADEDLLDFAGDDDQRPLFEAARYDRARSLAVTALTYLAALKERSDGQR
jgi:hypothetical protein